MRLITIDEAKQASISVRNLICKDEEELKDLLTLSEYLHIFENFLLQGILSSFCMTTMINCSPRPHPALQVVEKSRSQRRIEWW